MAVRDKPNKKLFLEQVSTMNSQIESGKWSHFFEEQADRLKMRKYEMNHLKKFRNENFDDKYVNVMTYGDALYKFCLYRVRLKHFKNDLMKVRKIRMLQNLVYEITNAVMNKKTALD